MQPILNPKQEKTAKTIIITASIAVPVLVAVLMLLPKTENKLDVHFLPGFHAVLNSCVSILLLLGFYFIKQKEIIKHRFCMTSALILSIVFLLSYVVYHTFAPRTVYGGDIIYHCAYFCIDV